MHRTRICGASFAIPNAVPSMHQEGEPAHTGAVKYRQKFICWRVGRLVDRKIDLHFKLGTKAQCFQETGATPRSALVVCFPLFSLRAKGR